MTIETTNGETYKLGDLVRRNLGKLGIAYDALATAEIDIDAILETDA